MQSAQQKKIIAQLLFYIVFFGAINVYSSDVNISRLCIPQNSDTTCQTEKHHIQFENKFYAPVVVVIRYKDLQSEWKLGSWIVDGNKKIILSSNGQKNETTSQTFYYYAYTTDHNYFWKGEHDIKTGGGSTYPMRKNNFSINFCENIYTFSISCENVSTELPHTEQQAVLAARAYTLGGGGNTVSREILLINNCPFPMSTILAYHNLQGEPVLDDEFIGVGEGNLFVDFNGSTILTSSNTIHYYSYNIENNYELAGNFHIPIRGGDYYPMIRHEFQNNGPDPLEPYVLELWCQ
ncbi:MAG: hypothetical protein D3925_12585 [Candidatus Electrothrix sp. AR5]|nr:hypothetical protein [Candidatus Electrothrix sp. AR5]